MGSVKFKDLKAYVRYDGSGRVVAGSLVFRKKKPKNGRWMEISSNLCCNASGTTTTTTTQGGGGITPTAFVRDYWYNVANSCITTVQDTIVFYSTSTELADGVAIYSDAALTIPVGLGFVINDPIQMKKYVVNDGGVLSEIYCQGNYWFGFSAQDACSQNYPAQLLDVATNNNTPFYPGTIIYANFASSGFYPGQTAYIRFSPGFAATRSISITSTNTAIVVGGLESCPAPSAFTGYMASSSAQSCQQSGGNPGVTLYTYPNTSLGYNVPLFFDSGLTSPYNGGYGNWFNVNGTAYEIDLGNVVNITPCI